MWVQLDQQIHLKRVVWQSKRVQLDYNSIRDCDVWDFEAVGERGSYGHFPITVSRIDSAGFTQNFMNEMIRICHLHEVDELTVKRVTVSTEMFARNYRGGSRSLGYAFSLEGHGRHSRVTWDASDFKVDHVLDQAGLMVLQDVVLEYLGVRMESILGKHE